MNATQSPEEWRPVLGYEGLYEVSDLGRVRSLDRTVSNRLGSYIKSGRMLSVVRTPPLGYQSVTLTRRDRGKRRRIHVLVLESFVGPRPPGMDGCHNDGDLDNNRLPNLRWDTRKNNILDVVRHGRHGQGAKTHCKRKHAFTSDNTYINPTSGSRQCKQCTRDARHAQMGLTEGESPCPTPLTP